MPKVVISPDAVPKQSQQAYNALPDELRKQIHAEIRALASEVLHDPDLEKKACFPHTELYYHHSLRVKNDSVIGIVEILYLFDTERETLSVELMRVAMLRRKIEPPVNLKQQPD